MSYKQFTITVLGIVGVIILLFSSFIYYIDPMWTFNHSNKFNNIQIALNEREQKASQVYFQDFPYNSLLIGSSRGTYINQNEFQKWNVYNFSVSDVSINDYESMIDFAEEKRGKSFEKIIVGVDFFKTSVKENQEESSFDLYRDRVTEPFYRYKNLLSLDVFKAALKNRQLSVEDEILHTRVYDRRNIASGIRLDEAIVKRDTASKIESFRNEFYGKNYEYYPEYKKKMLNLKKRYPESNMVVFTTPISTALFQAMVEEGHIGNYERWIRDLVSVYGGVYNFMYPNSITNDFSNYFDGHHFYPKVGDQIAHKLAGAEEDVPKDFGVFVTEENVESHLHYVKTLAEKY